jgi:peroxiredoxin
MSIKAGDKAPDFKLPGTSGEVALADLLTRGPVVVAFYPKDFTSG